MADVAKGHPGTAPHRPTSLHGTLSPPLEKGAKEVRLAQLGELTDDELAEIRKHADEAQEVIASGRPRNYVAMGHEGPIDYEQEAVDLWNRVREALP